MSEEEAIDWDEAMQQCGDDEEFLRELLDDLRQETDTQMEKISDTLEVSSLICNVRESPVAFYHGLRFLCLYLLSLLMHLYLLY